MEPPLEIPRDATSKKRSRPTKSKSSKRKHRVRFADTFAGIGGFRHGLEAIGWKCAYSIELDGKANQTYMDNFGSKHHTCGDITKEPIDSLPAFTVLAGGFPCQPFSTAGLAKNGAIGKGVREEHKLGKLVYTLLEWVEARKPKVCLFENVKGFLAKSNRDTVEAVRKAFDEHGYHLTFQMVNAKYWVPQNRERVFMIGIRKDVGGPLNLDMSKLPDRSTVPTIASLLEPREEVYEANKISPRGIAGLLRHSHERMRKGKSGFFIRIITEEEQKDPETLFPCFTKNYAKQSSSCTLLACGPKCPTKEEIYNFTDYHDYDKVVKELFGGIAPRKLNKREAARIMGFPEHSVPNPSKVQAHCQYGNAVVPPVISWIGEQIADHLNF